MFHPFSKIFFTCCNSPQLDIAPNPMTSHQIPYFSPWTPRKPHENHPLLPRPHLEPRLARPKGRRTVQAVRAVHAIRKVAQEVHVGHRRRLLRDGKGHGQGNDLYVFKDVQGILVSIVRVYQQITLITHIFICIYYIYVCVCVTCFSMLSIVSMFMNCPHWFFFSIPVTGRWTLKDVKNKHMMIMKGWSWPNCRPTLA